MFLDRLFGSLYMGYHRWGQGRYPFRPLAEIEAARDRRVHRMVAYAYRYVPYYREAMNRLGLRPDDFQTADDLASLPIMEREQLQRDPEYFASTAPGISRDLTVRNSGTTGRPCNFFYDRRTLFQDAAYGERARAAFTPLIGRSLGYRLTVIAMPSGLSGQVPKYDHEHALLPRQIDLERQYLSLLDPPEENLRLINEFKPDVIQSFGSYLGMFFKHIEASGASFHHPRAIRYTADALPESARRLIEDKFAIPVFSRYESMEAPNLAFECEQHNGVHVNIDLCPLRLVDGEGKTVPAGQSGEVIISNLINRASVFLNYRLGDLATWLPGRCPCGRSLPLLSHVEGRSDDWIVLPFGQSLHPQVVIRVYRLHPDIWQHQTIQETPTRLRVSLVTDAAADRQKIEESVRADLRRTLGEEIEVEIQFVDAIPRTPGGKVRRVISLAAQARLAEAERS